MEELILTNVKDYMLGYYIVSKIYDIRDNDLFNDEKVNYSDVILNLKLLNIIDEINFVYVKLEIPIEQIKEITKVGNLLNLKVYIDPLQSDDIITLINKDGIKKEIKIIF